MRSYFISTFISVFWLARGPCLHFTRYYGLFRPCESIFSSFITKLTKCAKLFAPSAPCARMEAYFRHFQDNEDSEEPRISRTPDKKQTGRTTPPTRERRGAGGGRAPSLSGADSRGNLIWLKYEPARQTSPSMLPERVPNFPDTQHKLMLNDSRRGGIACLIEFTVHKIR